MRRLALKGKNGRIMVRTLKVALQASLVIALALTSAAAAAAPVESVRLGRAKDYIADEQWTRAIAELRGVIADPKEKGKDEALYWLAHSLNQAGDAAAAIDTILRLEREYPSSIWVKPAGSLRLDIAIRMQRNDVLWWTAVPPPPPTPRAAPAPVPPSTYAPAPAPPAAPAPRVPRPPKASPTAIPTPVAAPMPPGSAPVPPTPPAPPMPPPTAWLPDGYHPDVDLRIEALGVLIRTDAKVIPMLREIAVDADDPGDARRAIFVLMQSGRPEARDTVFQVAKAGPEAAQLAAIRELGRFGGQQAFDTLLQVYEKANVVVKNQVVTSLGAGAQRVALVKIAESEKDPHLRDTAIVTLGRAGGGEQLRVLYQRGGAEIKRPIIVGLFTARQEDTLIRIADEEKDPVLRAECLRRLRLLGTPHARAYLQKVAADR
jgi:hypothetical protein